MPRLHQLRQSQWIPRAPNEVWEFFSDARNLEAITPPWLGFRIVTPPPIVMQAGTRIRYRIGLHGIPLQWTSVIRQWDPPHRFIDIQERGPYQLWHHTHRFVAEDGGTRMHDTVHYRLPLGIAGRILNALKVRGDLEKIFAYRHRRVEELFGSDARGVR